MATSYYDAEYRVETIDHVEEPVYSLLMFKDYAIVELDVSGHILSWNPGAKSIYGYYAEDIIGKHISACYTNESSQSGEPWHNLQVAREEGRCETEGWKCKKDGTVFYGNTILTAIYNTDGILKGFANVTRDITAQRKLEKNNNLQYQDMVRKLQQSNHELLVANDELAKLSHSVSQDLSVPMQQIGIAAKVLKDTMTVADKKTVKIMDGLITKAAAVEKCVKGLLSFSSMLRYTPVHKRVDMGDVVQACLTEIADRDDAGRCDISVGDLPACTGNPSMLKQLWMHLLNNAIKFTGTKRNRSITIGATSDAISNTFFVQDNGCGFPMKAYKRLFSLFQRLHSGDAFEGAGIGLAMAKRIVAIHKGEIWAHGTPGRGATFYFSIPKQGTFPALS